MHADQHDKLVSVAESPQNDDFVEQARELTIGYKLMQHVPANVAILALTLPVMADSDIPKIVARRYCHADGLVPTWSAMRRAPHRRGPGTARPF